MTRLNAHVHMSIRPIQVEGTLYLGQTDPGIWDIESAYFNLSTCTYSWSILTLML